MDQDAKYAASLKRRELYLSKSETPTKLKRNTNKVEVAICIGYFMDNVARARELIQYGLTKEAIVTEKFLQGCAFIDLIYKHPLTDQRYRRMARTGRYNASYSCWVSIRKLFELHGYNVAYPSRVGGYWNTPDRYPMYNFPFRLDLGLTQDQIDWVINHGWLVVMNGVKAHASNDQV